jgi:hypothetical protein
MSRVIEDTWLVGGSDEAFVLCGPRLVAWSTLECAYGHASQAAWTRLRPCCFALYKLRSASPIASLTGWPW